MAKCKGKAMWAYLSVLDTKYKPCWRIQLAIDKHEALKMIELGLKKLVKPIDPVTQPDKAAFGEYEVKFVRYEEKRGKFKGQKNKAPDVVNSDNEPFTEILGNGSDVIVKFTPYQWKNNFGTGTGVDLEAVKVINLVPYAPEGADDTKETPIESKSEEDTDDKW